MVRVKHFGETGVHDSFWDLEERRKIPFSDIVRSLIKGASILFRLLYINKNVEIDQHSKAIEKGQLKAETRLAFQTSLSSIQRHTGLIKTIIILTFTSLHSVYARYRFSVSHQHIKGVKACIFIQLYIYIWDKHTANNLGNNQPWIKNWTLAPSLLSRTYAYQCRHFVSCLKS